MNAEIAQLEHATSQMARQASGADYCISGPCDDAELPKHITVHIF